MAQAWGLNAAYVLSVTQSAIESTVKNGGVVWLCGNASSADGKNAPFGSTNGNGHCIAIRGIASDGTWKVYDTGFDDMTSHSANKTYDPAIVLRYTVRRPLKYPGAAAPPPQVAEWRTGSGDPLCPYVVV
ncbi:MAG: C39 family peptidase, partial [Actinomycetia bacterium]|nr:C39 family peptidase [Actinomycetes bacterium]